METDTERQMLEELRSHARLLRSANRAYAIALTWLGILVALAVVNLLFGNRIAEGFQARETPADSWRAARTLVDAGDLAHGKEMICRLIARNPRNYYGYRLMGFVEQELGDLKESEKNFTRACDLFPTEENEKNLAAIRRVSEKVGISP